MSTGAERPYLSIGEVLELLKEEFPDVSISRIRVLEAQGLLQLERTASGYRKFYDADVTHLRSVLRQHGASDPSSSSAGRVPRGPVPAAPAMIDLDTRPTAALPGDPGRADPADHDDEETEVHNGELPGQPERRHPASFATPRRSGAVARSARTHPASGVPGSAAGFPTAPAEPEARITPPPAAPTDEQSAAAASVEGPREPETPPRLALVSSSAPAVPSAPASDPEPVGEPGPASGPGRSPALLGSRNPLAANPSALSLSLDDLCRAAGVVPEQVRELESYGLLRGHTMFSTVYYDEDALLTCRLVAEFLTFGVEPRHLRMYKLAADREAAFFEQVVTPQLRRRNPDAKERAIETLGELVRLGEQLRVVALRQVLRAAVDPT